MSLYSVVVIRECIDFVLSISLPVILLWLIDALADDGILWVDLRDLVICANFFLFLRDLCRVLHLVSSVDNAIVVKCDIDDTVFGLTLRPG